MPFGITRGDLAEPPPSWAPPGMAPGYHEIRPDSMDDVDRICRMLGVSANDTYNRHTIAACVAPSIHAEILPADGLRDPEWMAATKAHEDAHTWGLVHNPGGRGWVDPTGQAKAAALARVLQTTNGGQ